jgi:hypothetical protein
VGNATPHNWPPKTFADVATLKADLADKDKVALRHRSSFEAALRR